MKLESKRDLISHYTNFIFDCDGCIWNSSGPLEGAFDALVSLLANPEKNVFFLTNDAQRTRKTLQKRIVDIVRDHSQQYSPEE